MNLRHACNADGCYMDTLWDWSPLNACFGDSGIRLSDMDGIVERNGHFLVLDGKRVHHDRRDISVGQRRLYLELAKRGFTTVVFHGEPPADVRYARMWLPGGAFQSEQPFTMADLQEYVRDWYQRVDAVEEAA